MKCLWDVLQNKFFFFFSAPDNEDVWLLFHFKNGNECCVVKFLFAIRFAFSSLEGCQKYAPFHFCRFKIFKKVKETRHHRKHIHFHKGCSLVLSFHNERLNQVTWPPIVCLLISSRNICRCSLYVISQLDDEEWFY